MVLVSTKRDDEDEPVLVLIAPTPEFGGLTAGAVFVQAGQPPGLYEMVDPSDATTHVDVVLPDDAVDLPSNGWYPGLFLEVDRGQGS